MAIGAATLYIGGQNSSNVGLPTSPSRLRLRSCPESVAESAESGTVGGRVAGFVVRPESASVARPFAGRGCDP